MVRSFIALFLFPLLLFLAGATPQTQSGSIDPALVRALITRMEQDFEAAESNDKATLHRLKKAEKKAMEKAADSASLRREAESYLHIKKSAERTAWAEVDRGQRTTSTANSATNQREAAEKSLEQAWTRERMDKATLEEERRAKETREGEMRKRHDQRKAISAELSKLKEEFQMSPTLAKGDEITDKVMQVAAAHGISSTIEWKTKRAEGRKLVLSPGAILYYQTKRGRERGDPARSLRNPTNCTQALPIGSYYVWAMRNGKPTSDQDRPPFTFIALSETATIEEIQ